MITTAYIITTNKCNMNCSYCYEKEFFKNRFSDMSLDMMNKTVDFLFDHVEKDHFAKPGEHVGVYYFGGEPTLNWDTIEQNMHYVKEKEKKTGYKAGIYFLTNGYRFPKNKINFFHTLKENNVKVQISLDGCQESHNAARGHFDEIVANVKELIKAIGSHPIIRMSVTADNLKYAFESFRVMVKLSCAVHLTLVPESAWTDEHIEIAKKEFTKIMNLYEKLSMRAPLAFNIAKGCINDSMRNCETGHNMVGIDIDGSIYPCHRFTFHKNKEDWKMGNVESSKIRYPILDPFFSECDGCECRICHPCPSQMILSDQGAPPEKYCAIYKAIQQVCEPIARKVHERSKEKTILEALMYIIGKLDEKKNTGS